MELGTGGGVGVRRQPGADLGVEPAASDASRRRVRRFRAGHARHATGVPSPTRTGAATLPERVRATCAAVAETATLVRIEEAGLRRMAAASKQTGRPSSRRPPPSRTGAPGTPARPVTPEVPAEWLVGDEERRCGLVLALDAVNFGSGWHPLLRKRAGLSGARTVATAFTEWWIGLGWPGPAQLLEIVDGRHGTGGAVLAAALGQPAGGEPGRLMAHFAASLAELAGWIVHAHDGRWSALPVEAGGSAARLAALLARLPHWDDRARHPQAGEVWLYKRAQIAAADLALAGLASFGDLDRLTCMADNLIPHVLRLDGVLVVDPSVVARIDREALFEAGEPAEVELRAVTVHAVERLTLELARRGVELVPRGARPPALVAWPAGPLQGPPPAPLPHHRLLSRRRAAAPEPSSRVLRRRVTGRRSAR